jgi:hypothetical protein
MSLMREIRIGLWAKWWFSAIFGAINLVLAAVYPKSLP